MVVTKAHKWNSLGEALRSMREFSMSGQEDVQADMEGNG